MISIINVPSAVPSPDGYVLYITDRVSHRSLFYCACGCYMHEDMRRQYAIPAVLLGLLWALVYGNTYFAA